jgi:hypothetical protein
MPLETTDPGYTLTVAAPGYLTQTLTVTIEREASKTVSVALTPGLAGARRQQDRRTAELVGQP